MDERYKPFCKLVFEHYKNHGRHDLPWRLPEPDGSFDPYKILVSEIMLQQTQVPRVLPKFTDFMRQFPTVRSLAEAPLKTVLIAWQGLGYNRRAKFLWQAAQMIIRDYDGTFPSQENELIKLPGIGKNTAGAILAYAFNQPAAFIETNIRTVFIHHFFKDQTNIPDKAILGLVTATLPGAGKNIPSSNSLRARRDENNRRFVSYREWYWSLMDYGTNLKQTVGNKSRASKAYTKQSKFQGSARQIRGQVLRLLAAKPMSRETLMAQLADTRTETILASLEAEGMISQSPNDEYELP